MNRPEHSARPLVFGKGLGDDIVDVKSLCLEHRQGEELTSLVVPLLVLLELRHEVVSQAFEPQLTHGVATLVELRSLFLRELLPTFWRPRPADPPALCDRGHAFATPPTVRRF